LVRQCSKDRLTDPPHRVRDELHALVRIELARRRHQTDVALLDQVDQRDTAILVLLGHTDHEPQVRADQRLHGLLIAGLRPMTQLDLLLRRQELVPADLAQILIECRALLTGACKPFHLYIRASATPTRLGHTSHSDRSPSEFDSTARAADSPYPTARSLPPRPLACLSGMPRRAYLKPRALTSSSACAGAGKLRSPSPPSRGPEGGNRDAGRKQARGAGPPRYCWSADSSSSGSRACAARPCPGVSPARSWRSGGGAGLPGRLRSCRRLSRSAASARTAAGTVSRGTPLWYWARIRSASAWICRSRESTKYRLSGIHAKGRRVSRRRSVIASARRMLAPPSSSSFRSVASSSRAGSSSACSTPWSLLSGASAAAGGGVAGWAIASSGERPQAGAATRTRAMKERMRISGPVPWQSICRPRLPLEQSCS